MRQLSRREHWRWRGRGAHHHRLDPAALRRGQGAAEEIAKFTGGKTLEKGKITIDLPEIAENGNTVPLSITVEAR